LRRRSAQFMSSVVSVLRLPWRMNLRPSCVLGDATQGERAGESIVRGEGEGGDTHAPG
jgi:hypothetical protein